MTPDEVRFMKTIQIPTTSNPFIVNINNHAYQYRAGETIEVPDEVAAAIEDALELEPKPGRNLNKFAQFVGGSIAEISEGDLEGVELIYPYVFFNCEVLTNIVLPYGVKSIGSTAFGYCNKLTSVTISESIKSIEEKAFSNCVNLKKVIMRAKTPPIIQANTFTSVPTTCVFEVPAEALEAYKVAPNWSTLAGTYTFVAGT